MVDKTSKIKSELLSRITEVRNLGFTIIDSVGIPLSATSIKDSPEYSDEKKAKQKVVLHFLNLTSDVLDWVLTKCKTEDDFLIQVKNLDFIEKKMEWWKDWEDGKLSSTENTLNYPDGGIYKGEFKDGVPHGTGTLKFPDGNSYIGQFKDGIINGQGTFMLKDGSNYFGEHKDGKPNGHGTLTLSNGEKRVGKFENGELVEKNN
ncbi:hypothetical protein N9X42_00085 [Candidatus Pelagibacter bacterium]|jgi:hypothetical protein|nr:hypothetical protein [Candidatus Pelagibacter bacterium]